MEIVKGDAIEILMDGEADVALSVCNCFCTMGAGFAKSVKENFPEVYEMDLQTTKGDYNKLGTIGLVDVVRGARKFIVVNMYGQYHFGSGLQVNYSALRLCLNKVTKMLDPKLTICYPKIGAGLAGGDWDVISKIIDKELSGRKHFLVEYNK